MFDGMTWLNEPIHWTAGRESLSVTSAPETDFWRKTHYGFTHDNGHFLHREVAGDFTATVTLSGDFHSLYDQAGLMIRGSERTWLKTGVEYTDDALHLSTVLTNGRSDWSVTPLPRTPAEVTLQVTCHGSTVRTQYLQPAGMIGQWQMLRLGHLPLKDTCQVGIMTCSPTRGGLHTHFRDLSIKTSHAIDLHPH